MIPKSTQSPEHAELAVACGPARSTWQRKSANGEVLWSWITWAFAAYWILFVAGAVLGRKELNTVGGVLVLGVLAWIAVERLWVRLDAVVIASLVSATCIPVLQLAFSTAPVPEALFKHVSLCLVIAIARMLRLPPASQSRNRVPLATHVLTILLISLTVFKGTSWDGGTRHSGLFVNPNNLALIPFLLLLFLNPQKDKWFVRIAAHAVVVMVLVFSGTSGAVLAYGIGLAVYLSGMVSKTSRVAVWGLAGIGGLTLLTFLGMGGERLLPETRLTNQISVIRVQLGNVLDGRDISYYDQERVLGSGSASGIWRVAHWRLTIKTYLDGTPAQQIVGFGIGSSPLILGKLPHNEYLRELFEQGIIGFLLFVFTWYRMIRSAPRHARYVGLIAAIYSFSENNLDNFPFMALLILCLCAREVSNGIKSKAKKPSAVIWRASAQAA